MIAKHFKLLTGLLLMWGLVACAPISTPVAVATATIIPSTATPTATPVLPTDSVAETATPIILITQSTQILTPILETNITLDVLFTREIMQALADALSINVNRVQLISVESDRWALDTLGCPVASDTRSADTINDDNMIVDGFRYQLLVGTIVYTYHTEDTARFIRCDGSEVMRDEVLLAVDPLAAETFRVVQNLLAGELDLSSRRVQLVTMQPVTWQDTSLGCPQDNVTYAERDIPGYHIVVSAGNEQYIYHSDSNTAYPCPIEQSTIPLE